MADRKEQREKMAAELKKEMQQKYSHAGEGARDGEGDSGRTGGLFAKMTKRGGEVFLVYQPLICDAPRPF
jgi:hypothetical protein